MIELDGRGQPLLYIGYEGVLHPNTLWFHKSLGPTVEGGLFAYAPILSQLLEPYPQVGLVLDTPWVARFGLSKAASYLPRELQRRIVGSTYPKSVSDTLLEACSGLHVLYDAIQRRPAGWVILQDEWYPWSGYIRDLLVASHPTEGISSPAVQKELKEKLNWLVSEVES